MNLQKTTILFTAVLGMSLYAQSAFAATTDHTHYWSFDDATGRSVGDTGGENGVMMASSSGFGWTSGKAGTALAFDGLLGEGVVLPNAFLKGSQGSLSVWFKIDQLTNQNIIFSGRSTTDSNVYGLLYVDYEGRPQFQYRPEANSADKKVQASGVLKINEWYHLVFTASGQTYKFYINGVEVPVVGDNNGRWFPDISNHVLSYRIGQSEASPLSGTFRGLLDELYTYDRVLTQDDALELYKKGNEGISQLPLDIRPVVVLSVSSDTVPYGGSVVLTWNASKVSSCEASGGWSGDVPLTGERSFVKLAGDATYTLSCVGEVGVVRSTARVLVGEDPSKQVVVTGTITPSGTLIVDDVTAKPATSTIPVLNLAGKSRQEQIQALLEQIVLLIAELQKELAVLKAAAH